jgi:hypothetical protein
MSRRKGNSAPRAAATAATPEPAIFQKTELISELWRCLDPMEDDSLSIFQYSTLLGVLTAGPDADSAIDGIHRLMLEIREHAENLIRQREAAVEIVQRLANPA